MKKVIHLYEIQGLVEGKKWKVCGDFFCVWKGRLTGSLKREREKKENKEGLRPVLWNPPEV